MEKKRRARINDSLETLKQILLESKTTSLQQQEHVGGGAKRTAKLEKADILEMTVTYVQNLRRRLARDEAPIGGKVTSTGVPRDIVIRSADSSSDGGGVTLVPTKLTSGEIVFVVPASLKGAECPEAYTTDRHHQISEQVMWRPW